MAKAATKKKPAAAARKKKSAAPAAHKRIALAEAEQDLVARLSERTGLAAQEILERALSSYALAVAPGMPLLPQKPPPKAPKGSSGEQPLQRLFLSVDGKPEVEIAEREFVLGAGEGCNLRLDLPLISPRHARILWKEGKYLFEDLHSTRGSYQRGEPVSVRWIEDGDEVDLGGFLPVRFRLA